MSCVTHLLESVVRRILGDFGIQGENVDTTKSRIVNGFVDHDDGLQEVGDPIRQKLELSHQLPPSQHMTTTRCRKRVVESILVGVTIDETTKLISNAVPLSWTHSMNPQGAIQHTHNPIYGMIPYLFLQRLRHRQYVSEAHPPLNMVLALDNLPSLTISTNSDLPDHLAVRTHSKPLWTWFVAGIVPRRVILTPGHVVFCSYVNVKKSAPNLFTPTALE